MTVLSRGGRNRRGGRRPGWLLLTVMLVLAIAASSALVFTNRVELLKLAVVLSLWAAVVAAFVSVIYRRQSDVDAARARDLKLVYDLQLDREISARREYELNVESHLRRELAAELRAQASDEVAALRAELAALRANLEILFEADLGDRPALEGDRAGTGYGDWTADTTTIPATPGRVASSRITPVSTEDGEAVTGENPIIDVPEEPLATPQAQPYVEAYQADYRGSHRRAAENGEPSSAPGPPPAPEPPEPVAQQPGTSQWQPVQAEGRWLPPGAPGSNWVARPSDNGTAAPPPEPGPQWPAADGPRPEPAMQPSAEPAAPRARHSVQLPGQGVAAPAMSTAPPPEPAARHVAVEDVDDDDQGPQGAHTGGQSVAELLARLQADGPVGGGRRRRREEQD